MSYDIFLKIKGIKGDSTDEKHKEWIEVKSYKHDIHNPFGGAFNSGDSGAYVGTKASHFDFEIIKRLDVASPMIFQYCHGARAIKEVTLELCRAMGEKTPFMKYTFTNAIISGVEPEGCGQTDDMLPTEKIKFRYAKIGLEYTPTDPKGGGKKGASTMVQVDLTGQA